MRSLNLMLLTLLLCAKPTFALPAPGLLATSSSLAVIGVVAPDPALPGQPLLVAVVSEELSMAPEPLPAPAGKSWHRPIERLALAGLLLLPLDAETMPSIEEATAGARNSFAVDAANSLGTPQVIFPALGALYLAGDTYDKETAKLAAVALINAGVLVQTGKSLAGRARPTTPSDTLGEFEGPRLNNEYASFPSGHATVAFAVANVLAHRYPKRKWLYYGLAGVVGLARIISEAHFPSDVLVGAATGMYAGESALRSKGRVLAFTW